MPGLSPTEARTPAGSGHSASHHPAVGISVPWKKPGRSLVISTLSIPAGAEAAVLYGDLGKEGMFAFRLKLPKDYHIAPHTHPKPEIVTVISGTARLSMGATADRTKAQALPAGSFFVMAPGMTHYFFADEDIVIQLNSTGPWGIAYVNPKDDPRQKRRRASARHAGVCSPGRETEIDQGHGRSSVRERPPGLVSTFESRRA